MIVTKGVKITPNEPPTRRSDMVRAELSGVMLTP